MMILSPLGLFALSNPWVTGEAVSFMISESAATQFSWMISESKGMLVMSNPCVTVGSSFVDDF
jgi:hypothetical protein